MQWSRKFMFIWGSTLLSLRISQAANVALGGVATQSSLWDVFHPPGMAIDNYATLTCAATYTQDNAWWRVDLGSQYDMPVIEVTGRTDCCPEQLDGAEIRIGNSLENNGNNNSRCAVIKLTGEVVMTFHCKMSGRYVNIFLPGVNVVLTICDVKVYPASEATGVNVALGGVAAESSEYEPHPSILASVAIDGKAFTNYFDWSCTSTAWEANPWWRVDLRGPYDILTIEVTRRTDCCTTFINGAEIRIGNSLENNGNNNPRCAVITVSSDVTMTFNCQMSGRYVNIVIPGSYSALNLCEVKVYATTEIKGVDVAPMGVATQSAATTADMAIDKHPGPKQPRQTCASVRLQVNPWWQLDLRSIYRITAVSIMSVGECCPEELNGAEVRIGFSTTATSNQRCAVISTTEGQRIYNYHCGVMDGRFVHIVLPGLLKTLTVCEVKVYGTVLENVALRGVAFQSSSTLEKNTGANNVIDGRLITCSNTKKQPGQWVTVDLLVPYNVTVIQLAYYQDCCYSDDVQVDNKSCGVIPSSSQSKLILDCGGIVGRYVTVMHPDTPPPLCEVEVYSTWTSPQSFPRRAPPHDHCLRCISDYIVIRNDPKTWFEAQAYCRERYDDIATINSNQDMSRVFEVMGNNVEDLWIGLYEDSATWKWSDGSDLSFTYWSQEALTSSGDGPNCAHVSDRKWSVTSCDKKSMFLCTYYKKKTMVRISTKFDMSDPDIQQQILSQVRKKKCIMCTTPI
ncbi:uncharacterized protein LOC131989196 [Centropristis striata]|uniref:uncharacterized protein LOC131989196 n=1 Tax=Centropristis striata TaxID=184440 RepID=UPI0027DFBC36|nr:uncharacterized protein LOC131989196 [Centropristis striata]